VAIWTQADIDALKAAVASGLLTVSYSGPPARTITYQSLTAMRALLAEMVADVAGETGARRRYRRGAIKGFNE
jgi:hypothetical protein